MAKFTTISIDRETADKLRALSGDKTIMQYMKEAVSSMQPSQPELSGSEVLSLVSKRLDEIEKRIHFMADDLIEQGTIQEAYAFVFGPAIDKRVNSYLKKRKEEWEREKGLFEEHAAEIADWEYKVERGEAPYVLHVGVVSDKKLKSRKQATNDTNLGEK